MLFSMNLSQTILGVTFENPTVLASGIMGIHGIQLAAGGGERSRGHHHKIPLAQGEHKGHRNPTIISTEHWTLNAVGVPDAGPEKARERKSAAS